MTKRWMATGALALFLPSSTHAATYRVPADVPTVLRAADLAVAGDSILVGPGTWTDREERWVVINGSPGYRTSSAFVKPGVALIAEQGPDQTILDGGVADPYAPITVLVTGEVSGMTAISGFTILGEGTGIILDIGVEAEISDCRIVEPGLKGISIIQASARLVGCLLEGCSVLAPDDTPRGAISMLHGGILELYDTRLVGNHRGGLRLDECSRVVVEDCEIVGHKEYGGASLTFCQDVQIRRSLFAENTSLSDVGYGPGLQLWYSDGIVEFNSFVRDSSHNSYNGGLFVSNSTVAVENNTFFACFAEWGGAAAGISGPDPGFRRNVIANSRGGAALSKTGGPMDPSSGCNILWDNEGGDYRRDWQPNPTDLPADPRFCDPATDDLRVEPTSPCLPDHNPCGVPIGAFGEGCGAVAVDETSWTRIKARYLEEGGR